MTESAAARSQGDFGSDLIHPALLSLVALLAREVAAEATSATPQQGCVNAGQAISQDAKHE
ncbi:hypothetical protein [Alsobacter sp. SYSU BS001988]